MAHAAKIDNQGIVETVIVVNEMYDDLTCEEWCEKTYGGVWKKTSYNTYGGVHKLGGTPFRKNYAGIGFTYNPVKDAFISPKPFNGWILNDKTCQWNPPFNAPNDGKEYRWDENILNWVIIN